MNIIISRTEDIDKIARIMNHPGVHKWITDDCSPSVHVPEITDSIIYLVDDTGNGVIQLSSINGICCQAHIALTPALWGKGVEFTKACIYWTIQHTRYMKAVALIPVFNRLTISLVKKVGFMQEGLITKSFLKDWKLYDQAVFGLTKKDFLNEGGSSCQQQV